MKKQKKFLIKVRGGDCGAGLGPFGLRRVE
jgi:hypothetical protein